MSVSSNNKGTLNQIMFDLDCITLKGTHNQRCKHMQYKHMVSSGYRKGKLYSNL